MAQAEAHGGSATPAVDHEGQEHPIKLYLVVWGWLFVLSTFSYLVDYFHLQGYLRHPYRYHDLRSDQLERHDGHGRQLRLPTLPARNRDLIAGDCAARCHVRQHAGLRVDQADHRRRPALE